MFAKKPIFHVSAIFVLMQVFASSARAARGFRRLFALSPLRQ
jgi:hypothetical protein